MRDRVKVHTLIAKCVLMSLALFLLAANANAHHIKRAIDQVNLTVVDVSSKSADVGRVTAIGASKDWAVVRLNSQDPEIIEIAETTLKTLVMLGHPRVALLVAKGENGFDNTASLYLRAEDGKPIAFPINMEAWDAEESLHKLVDYFYPESWRGPQMNDWPKDADGHSIQPGSQ